MSGQWWHPGGVMAVMLGGLVLGVCATTATTAAAPPATDDRGFVDSTARCAAPSRAIAYGYTSSSRIAVCKDDGSGQYQYRGVRVSDGARLILSATSTDSGYVAENDGITYTVTAAALTINSGSQQIRSEPMVEFHGSAPGGASSTSSAPTTAKPSTQSSAVPETTTPTTPLPPPLPAEVGHA